MAAISSSAVPVARHAAAWLGSGLGLANPNPNPNLAEGVGVVGHAEQVVEDRPEVAAAKAVIEVGLG